jgi:hypothetical protein
MHMTDAHQMHRFHASQQGVVAVPGWSGRVTGNDKGCATALRLEREQNGSESARN